MASNPTKPRLKLTDLAHRINRAHRDCERALKSGLQHALEAGRLLLEARATVNHGQWLQWVREHCDFPARLVQKYMQVARGFRQLDRANTPHVAHLTFRSA